MLKHMETLVGLVTDIKATKKNKRLEKMCDKSILYFANVPPNAVINIYSWTIDVNDCFRLPRAADSHTAVLKNYFQNRLTSNSSTSVVKG